MCTNCFRQEDRGDNLTARNYLEHAHAHTHSSLQLLNTCYNEKVLCTSQTVDLGAHSTNRCVNQPAKTCCSPLPITRPHLSAGTAYVTSCSPPGPPMLQSPRPRRPIMPPNPSRSCRTGEQEEKKAITEGSLTGMATNRRVTFFILNGLH